MLRAARSRTALDRFLAARRGSTAVEFAMVAMPFFFMMFAVLELAFVFVLDSVLENAVIETGRLVRTGQAESQGFNATQFKTSMCGRMSIFSSDCMAERLSSSKRYFLFSSGRRPGAPPALQPATPTDGGVSVRGTNRTRVRTRHFRPFRRFRLFRRCFRPLPGR